MERYLVTGSNTVFWNSWGLSWLASLKEFANYNGKVLIVHKGDFSPNLLEKIRKHVNATAIPTPGISEKARLDVYAAVAEYSRTQPGVYVYYDLDVYFQDSLEELFAAAANNIVLCKNKNPGMLGGSHESWQLIQNVLNLLSLTNPQANENTLVQCLSDHFARFVETQDNIWNFAAIPNLKAMGDKLGSKSQTAKVVHPSGEIKNVIVGRSILFSERHPALFNHWTSVFNSRNVSPRGFFKPRQKKHERSVSDMGEQL